MAATVIANQFSLTIHIFSASRRPIHSLRQSTFQMVEIEPLLAFQFVVDTDRSTHHCHNLSSPPTLDELFDLCLPPAPTNDEIQFSHQGKSIIIRSRSLNLVTTAEGPLTIPQQPATVGVQFSWTLPFVHVVRFNGVCFLFNGYHRAYGARMAGATQIPCLFRDVTTYEDAGVKEDGTTFPSSLFTSPAVPTLGHFTQGRAYPVLLRAAARIIHVSWSDHIVFEE